jgi:formylglycine-generating enzyme required for sulfatase activity/predicted Ser/Thr protein kinase
MSEFLSALESFRRGVLSRDELLGEVERQFASGEADSDALLAALQSAEARGRLPGNIHDELVRALRRGRAAPKLARAVGSAGRPPDEEEAVEEALTVVIDDGDWPADLEPPATNRARRGISAGTVLKGRFRLIEPIGEGGMSTVYKAIDLRKVEARAPKILVAVKLLSVQMTDFTPALQLLQAEAHKLQRLPHPNIIRVIDCDRDGRTVFMTMEYLTGESLKRKTNAKDFSGMPATEASEIIECIANGLAFAHRHGIVHGDLKPGNVLMTDEGEVKIIDFGVARLMSTERGAGRAGEERPKLSALTPPYASPEMLERAEPDPRDDIYALACIAHELLTGRHPFDRRVANEARDSGLKLVRHNPLTAAQFRAIAHGLEFDRAKRTPTAEQFLQEFRAKPRIRAGTAAGVAGAVVIAALGAAYFLKRGAAPLETPRSVSAIVPAPGEEFRDCPTCPRMRALAPGRFNQGAAADAADGMPFERPQHPVVIGYPFGMSIYEVTVGEFREFAAATDHKGEGCVAYEGAWQANAQLSWDNAGYPQSSAHPVTCVSWRDASNYAAWLSKKTGQKYRLPSESEWEYAARGGSDSTRPWGESASACVSANVADLAAAQRYPGWKAFPCNDGYVYTAPVGSFKPNAFGLYDMLGNAAEWVRDCWHDSYQGAPADGSAWLNGDCSERDLRGGSWFTAPSVVSLSARNRFADAYRSNSVGFRLVREIRQ